LINGKLILEKRIHQFAKWVKAYNCRYRTDIEPILQPAPINLENAWLTGFADADGSFNILITYRSGNPRLRIRFYLDQADAMNDLVKIQSVIGGTLMKRKNYNANNSQYFRLIVDTFTHAEVLIHYFSRFVPLTTHLKVRFIRYKRVFAWYRNQKWKTYLTKIQHLIRLNQRMNMSNIE